MDQDKPGLIHAGEEILDHISVIERDLSVLIEAAPIVEHIAGIGEERGLAEPVRERDHRAGECRWNGGRRFALTPDPGLDHERDMDESLTGFEICQRFDVCGLDLRERTGQPGAYTACRQHVRQRPGDLCDLTQLAFKVDTSRVMRAEKTA